MAPEILFNRATQYDAQGRPSDFKEEYIAARAITPAVRGRNSCGRFFYRAICARKPEPAQLKRSCLCGRVPLHL
ncbi:hypothetical protein Y1Q_0006376 [Alligator mississippiensis]|uniref:Uncharacterized protein n=1 Tax=Alligator mississippiensis TaxID=8496 RepID=A0A151NXL1_ALLMI|nr:hypothetical protein Y1Q_0006376 [Alligator mississippiensis]